MLCVSHNNMAAMLLLLLAFIVITSQSTSALTYTATVTTTNGPIRGRVVQLPNGKSVQQFLGVPFATADRFSPPKAPLPWNSVQDTVAYGKACPQLVNPGASVQSGVWFLNETSEDCLNLNIYVPKGVSSGGGLAVMVYIHGGAFNLGSSRLYDGTTLCTLGGVIVVVIQYRLGALGFLWTGKDITGNYGLLDQIQALIWVKQNIAAFGGDVSNVTIFGEATGGGCVGLLMLSPPASGLFKNAIMQSGPSPTSFTTVTKQRRAHSRASSFVKELGCESVDAARACLASKSPAELISATYKVAVPPLNGFNAVVDGQVLPDDPITLLEQGKVNPGNLIIGSANDEGAVFTSNVPGKGRGPDLNSGLPRSKFLEAARKMTFTLNDDQNLKNAIIYRYTDWSAVDDPFRNRRMYVDMGTDAMFAAPAMNFASGVVKSAANAVYFYQWTHRYPYFAPGLPAVSHWVRAYHGSNSAYIFGQVLNASDPYSVDGNYTRDVITRWTNFAKTGDPNQPENSSIFWPQYNNVSQQYLELGIVQRVHAKFRPEYMAFWNWFVPNYVEGLESSTPSPATCSQACSIYGGFLLINLMLVIIFQDLLQELLI